MANLNRYNWLFHFWRIAVVRRTDSLCRYFGPDVHHTICSRDASGMGQQWDRLFWRVFWRRSYERR